MLLLQLHCHLLDCIDHFDIHIEPLVLPQLYIGVKLLNVRRNGFEQPGNPVIENKPLVRTRPAAPKIALLKKLLKLVGHVAALVPLYCLPF